MDTSSIGFAGAYVAGFLSSLTPCVYPLIPITLAIFGAAGNLSRFRAFLLSATYVLGICVTYTALGMLSARFGVLFGAAFANPYVSVALACFMFIFALQSLEVFELPFISNIQTKASGVSGKGAFSAFIMGALSGLVAAPCVGPVLVGILSIAAKSQSPAYGAALLFCYSLGLGTIFLFLGTFSGAAKKLPRSGNWMHAVKFIIAVGVIMVGLFMLQSVISYAELPVIRDLPAAAFWGSAAIGILLAVLSYRKDLMLGKIIAAVLVALSLFLVLVPQVRAAATPSEHVWIESETEALNAARTENKIVMVDLFADWCAACKELDAITFRDEDVKKELAKIRLARLDMTNQDEEALRLQEKYSVIGLPCILFLQPSGEEIPNSRITGFLPPKEFILHLKSRQIVQ